MSIDNMCSVVEDYIYKRKNVRVTINRGSINNYAHFQML